MVTTRRDRSCHQPRELPEIRTLKEVHARTHPARLTAAAEAAHGDAAEHAQDNAELGAEEEAELAGEETGVNVGPS